MKSCLRRYPHHLSTALLAAMAMALAAPAAWADSEVGGLEEVIVTASKRETPLLKTPIAVSALTGESLEKQGIEQVRDLATSIPNLQMGSNGDASTAIAMRGVSSTDTTEVAEAAVSVHQDGFYSPRPQAALALMYDVERVEVMRGPQGTLFGMNSPGGVINIVPVQPQFGQNYARVLTSAGNYNARELRATYNLALGDQLALRANYMLVRHDGYNIQVQDFTDLASPANGIALDGIPDVDQRYNHPVSPSHYYNNQDEWAARLIARWKPSDVFELTGTVSRYANNGAGDLAFEDCKAALGTPAQCNHPLRYLKINVPGYVHMTLDDLQVKAAYTLNESALLEYRLGIEDQKRTQMTDTDSGVSPPAAWSSIGEPLTFEQQTTQYYPVADSHTQTRASDYRSYTSELQLKSTGKQRVNYVVGAFYLHEIKQIAYAMDWLESKSFDSGSGALIDGLPYGVFFDQKDRSTISQALFGQLDFSIAPRFDMTLGARYSWDRKGDHNGYEYGNWSGNTGWYNGLYTPTGVRAHQSTDLQWNMGTNAPLGSAANPLTYITDSDRRWSQGTYRFGLQYNPDGDTMFYGSIATGYKMGGMYEAADFCNNGCLKILEYGPENVTNYEVGYKGKLADGRLQLSTALFLSNYRGMQNTGNKVVGIDTNPVSPTMGRPVVTWTTDNLPKSRISGLEIEFESTPWKNGQFGGYLSWLKTEVIEGTIIDGYACAERILYGQTPCGAPDAPVSLHGHQLPFAPEYSATLHYQHTLGLSGGWQLQPLVSAHWQSKMWLDIFNYDGAHLSQSQSGYLKWAASARLTWPSHRMHVELLGENLGNVDTKNFQSEGPGMLMASYDPPRIFGLRFGFER